MKSSRITRVVKILTTLQAEKSYTADELASLFGKSRRTIFRDLKELTEVGVPYHYDNKTGGYRVDPSFFLPPIDLNLQEALSLLLMAHRAGSQMQLPFKNSALLAALKIENNLPMNIRRYCGTALRNISAMHNPQAAAESLDEVFGVLYRAMQKKHKVTMEYDSIFDGKVITVELSPYHMSFNRRAWYVMGHSDIHGEARTFKLGRVKKAEAIDKCFIEEEQFEVAEHFGRAWSMIPEGRLYNVKLKFLPKVARNVAEVHWHNTQQATWQEDGSVVLEFRVDGIGEISWWVMGYGDQVQVLGPMALKDRIVAAAKRMVELNGD